MSYLSTYTGLVLLDSRNQEGTLALPSASTVEGRALYFKDEFAAFGLSSVTLSTIGVDVFENGQTLFTLNQADGFGLFIAASNTWFCLGGTSNTNEIIDSLFASSIVVSSISTYGLTVTGPNTLKVYGSSIFETVEAQRFTAVSSLMFGSETLSVQGGTLFINGSAVGSGGGASGSVFSTIQTSTLNFDGQVIVPTAVFPISTGLANVRTIKHLGGQWFAGGDPRYSVPNSIETSVDGLRWTQCYTPSTSVADIDYNGSNLYVAVGGGYGLSTIMTSVDGITWVDQLTPYTTFTGLAVKYASSIWMIGGYNNGDRNGTILTSYDGSNWTACSTTLDHVEAIEYGSGIWVAVGPTFENYNSVTSSSDAVNWNYVYSEFWTSYDVKYTSSLWVVAGERWGSGSVQWSPDLVTWSTQIITDGPYPAYGIDYNPTTNQWVAVGFTGQNMIATSSNLGDWNVYENTSSNLQTIAYAVHYADNKWLVGGPVGNRMSTSFLLSSNANSWSYEVSTICTITQRTTLSVSQNTNILFNGSQSLVTEVDLVSTIEGLSNLGYVTGCNLASTTAYFTGIVQPSTVAGLGTAGYLSSFFIVSTTAGIADSILPSTTQGLGTVGYVSTSGFLSTTASLNTLIQTNTSYFTTAWSSYTVEWHAATTNPSLGNGGLSGRFKKIGTNVSFFIDLTPGTTTTFGTGDWTFSLPVNAFSTYSVLAHATMYDTSASNYFQGLALSHFNAGNVSTVSVIWNKGAQIGQAVDRTTPFNWSSNDQLNISGTYECL